MRWLWTWGGKFFGYRLADNLYTYQGKHVGRFTGSEVFGADGLYVGEIRGTDRLVSDKTKASFRKPPFAPEYPRSPIDARPDAAEYTMYGDIDDFRSPESF